ncbi:MAG: DUF4974 domain-containing protein [Dysgonomonas sp.]
MPFAPSDLVIKYLNKSLDKDGLDEFYNWISENPENKKLFFETKAIFDTCTIKEHAINIDKSWDRLLNKKYNKTSFNLWRYVGRYAAVALITLILTSTFFIFQKRDQEQPICKYIGGNGIEADMVILPDGTRVSIGTKTKFYCAPDYNQKDRVVYLEGEAMFEVAKQKKKPFIVKVNGQDIEAVGTKFNVMAYPSDSIFSTTLLEGSVRLTTQGLAKETMLKPDQQFRYNRNHQTSTIEEVDASLYTSWVNGYYHFPDQTFQTILSRLSNIYGLKIQIKRNDLKTKRFTGTFYRGQNIKEILEIISISIPIKYEIEEGSITIY